MSVTINPVYITNTSAFLPNKPVSNEEMEGFLGLIHHEPSRSKRIVLRNNGIKTRYYAIDKNGNPTHSNAEMVSLAIRKLFQRDKKALKNIDLLSCGTSTPDQLIPSHGVMVHGWLKEARTMEVVSLSGVCCSGMHAFKYAWMAVKLGDAKNAIATGSERVSRTLRAEAFEEEANKLEEAEKDPHIVFDKEFLRWMLSDGAGAVLLSNKKNEKGISLRIDWLEGVSYAHLVEPCMYMGAEKLDDGTLKSYMDYSPSEVTEHSIMSIKQDIKLLSEHIVSLGFGKMKSVLEANNMSVDDIDYFLPHISSEFFRSKMSEKFDADGVHIPQEKWFTNLSKVGNVGAGSIYLMLEELFHSGKLKKGQKVFMLVPESARFSYMFGLLTVC